MASPCQMASLSFHMVIHRCLSQGLAFLVMMLKNDFPCSLSWCALRLYPTAWKSRKICLSDHCLSSCRITNPEDSNLLQEWTAAPPSAQVIEGWSDLRGEMTSRRRPYPLWSQLILQIDKSAIIAQDPEERRERMTSVLQICWIFNYLDMNLVGHYLATMLGMHMRNSSYLWNNF